MAARIIKPPKTVVDFSPYISAFARGSVCLWLLNVLDVTHSFRITTFHNGYLTTIGAIWRLAVVTAALSNVAEVQSIGRIYLANKKWKITVWLNN